VGITEVKSRSSLYKGIIYCHSPYYKIHVNILQNKRAKARKNSFVVWKNFSQHFWFAHTMALINTNAAVFHKYKAKFYLNSYYSICSPSQWITNGLYIPGLEFYRGNCRRGRTKCHGYCGNDGNLLAYSAMFIYYSLCIATFILEFMQMLIKSCVN
jgi:hypothetical protein